MAVAFVEAGSQVANATTTTLSLVVPNGSTVPGDFMVAVILGKNNQTVSAPAGWNLIAELNNTANQRISVFAKFVAVGEPGSTQNFTKTVDDNILFYGIIATWRGVDTGSGPTPQTSTSANAVAADQVDYADYDPDIPCHVLALGVYNNDVTTAGAIAGTDPTFTNRFDGETNVGTDGSIFIYDGESSGAATGARSHATSSAIDAISIGVLYGLPIAPPAAGLPAGRLPLLGAGR